MLRDWGSGPRALDSGCLRLRTEELWQLQTLNPKLIGFRSIGFSVIGMCPSMGGCPRNFRRIRQDLGGPQP